MFLTWWSTPLEETLKKMLKTGETANWVMECVVLKICCKLYFML